MSAATDYDTGEDWQRMVMKWTSAGHVVVHERQTFRHKAYMKDLDPEMPVKLDGVQMIMSNGHALKVGDILPERADLALDADGNVLQQHEFVRRYLEYLNWFNFIEGSDPKAEYIPAVSKWICQTPDTFSESPGMVEVGYDANVPAPEERTHRYDQDKDEMVAIARQNSEVANTTLEAVKTLLEDAKKDSAEPPKRGPGRPSKESKE